MRFEATHWGFTKEEYETLSRRVEEEMEHLADGIERAGRYGMGFTPEKIVEAHVHTMAHIVALTVRELLRKHYPGLRALRDRGLLVA